MNMRVISARIMPKSPLLIALETGIYTYTEIRSLFGRTTKRGWLSE